MGGFQAAMEGQDLAGRTIVDFPALSVEVCCLACGRKEDCQGFASFEDRCYLEADVGGTFEKPSCQVILKEGILSEATVAQLEVSDSRPSRVAYALAAPYKQEQQ